MERKAGGGFHFVSVHVTVKFPALVNGDPEGFFFEFEGLVVDIPAFHLLFPIIMEALCHKSDMVVLARLMWSF